MQKEYWALIERDKIEGQIDYKKEDNNTALVIIKDIHNKKIEGFLEVLENKWLIRGENFELIFTTLIFMYTGENWIVFEESSLAEGLYFEKSPCPIATFSYDN